MTSPTGPAEAPSLIDWLNDNCGDSSLRRNPKLLQDPAYQMVSEFLKNPTASAFFADLEAKEQLGADQLDALAAYLRRNWLSNPRRTTENTVEVAAIIATRWLLHPDWLDTLDEIAEKQELPMLDVPGYRQDEEDPTHISVFLPLYGHDHPNRNPVCRANTVYTIPIVTRSMGYEY